MSAVLTPDEERVLLDLARRAIGHYFETGGHLQAAVEDPKLEEKRGAFVTLKVEGELRGCVGYPLPYKPLAETVVEMAVAAASQDFRFEPLAPEELAGTRIEISVLSLPEPVDDPKEVEVGRHGIVVSKGFNRGLLLPQVPVEQGWDRETYLRHGCLKAGLGPDEWKKGAKIEVFTAQVFSEPE
ncbi:MAG: AmmeMemoRadiSam system protein A [Candidatus Aminicenantales bacterium]|jgi:AmmeMemoRadiSam system protein A